MKNFLSLFGASFFALSCFAQNDAIPTAQDAYIEESIDLAQELDSIERSFNFEYGTVDLGNGTATLEVPTGFKYLGPAQSDFVMTEIWGNPTESTLGMLFQVDTSPLDDSLVYAVDISYSEEGFIDDEDAADLNYEELLAEMQKDTQEGNQYRKQEGYPTIQLLGWASDPFYDPETKKIHWAKELRFEGYEESTLNYTIRILGRKGYVNMNAIGGMEALPDVQRDINKIIGSVEFNEGNTYADFDSSIDEVAAYGIGGLIAGKILAKAGFFALILKFWKIIAMGAVATLAVFQKKIFGSE
ncbi:MAG: putative membrane-anchored protein [Salibacteraceae bacterium]|jgi:uncharacterized membrane-anchored protein